MVSKSVFSKDVTERFTALLCIDAIQNKYLGLSEAVLKMDQVGQTVVNFSESCLALPCTINAVNRSCTMEEQFIKDDCSKRMR